MRIVVWGSVVLATLMLGTVGVPAQQATQTIWAGVFSAPQDQRGIAVHSAVCARCHGPNLNGAGQPDAIASPAIARVGFLMKWENKTLAELFDYVKMNMPVDNPGTRTDQEYIDAIAHMLALSGAKSGTTDLPADMAALAKIVIKAMP